MSNNDDFNRYTSNYTPNGSNNPNNNNGGNNYNNMRYTDYYNSPRNDSYSGYEYCGNEVASQVISRSFLIMVIALVVTALSAVYTLKNESLLNFVYGTRSSFLILSIVEIVIVLCTTSAINKNKASLAMVLFGIYSICNGMIFSSIFIVYDLGSIQQIFVLAAVVFGVMAFIGFTTKKDLTKLGSIAMMALIGIIITTIFNIFIFKSQGLDMLMNYVGVLVFVGLTAYDTQRMRNNSKYVAGNAVNSMAVFFAIELYLDLINLFLRLLAIFGKRND